MALWEYKVITSGKGGFATPALLESYLNQLGADEWEIVEFRTQPDNPLAFSGLVRRPTQRDWTLEAAAAAAARAEADKLRAEFAAKFQAATSASAGAEASTAGSADADKLDRDEAFRRPRDTEHDQDPYALDDSSAEEGEEEWPEQDQLPSFFEAIRPHMRRNQKGPGHSVSVDFLVKKFDLLEEDLITALKECGFEVPEDEDDKPVYIEYDGDLYWVNTNRRGELWINTREKPRPVFKVVKGNRLTPEDAEAAEVQPGRKGGEQQRQRREESESKRETSQPAAPASDEASPRGAPDSATPAQAESARPSEEHPKTSPADSAEPAAPLPEGATLLDKLRPLMRRSRGGWSGTIGYLSRALKHSDAELLAALAGQGLLPGTGSEKAPVVEVGGFAYWLNRDGRGGVWINVREARKMRQQERPEEGRKSEVAAAAVESPVPAAGPSEAIRVEAVEPGQQATPAEQVAAVAAVLASIEPSPASPEVAPASSTQAQTVEPPPATLPLAGVRLLLKQTRTGAFAGEVGFLASKLERSPEDFLAVLVQAGLVIPEKPREKPVFVEHASEIFWLNRNAKGELWLNAKPAKYPTAASEEGETDEMDASDSTEKKGRRPPRPRRRSQESQGTQDTAQ